MSTPKKKEGRLYNWPKKQGAQDNLTINTHEGKRGSLIQDLNYQTTNNDLTSKQTLLKQIVELGFKKFAEGTVINEQEKEKEER